VQRISLGRNLGRFLLLPREVEEGLVIRVERRTVGEVEVAPPVAARHSWSRFLMEVLDVDRQVADQAC